MLESSQWGFPLKMAEVFVLKMPFTPISTPTHVHHLREGFSQQQLHKLLPGCHLKLHDHSYYKQKRFSSGIDSMICGKWILCVLKECVLFYFHCEVITHFPQACMNHIQWYVWERLVVNGVSYSSVSECFPSKFIQTMFPSYIHKRFQQFCCFLLCIKMHLFCLLVLRFCYNSSVLFCHILHHFCFCYDLRPSWKACEEKCGCRCQQFCS